QQKAAADAGSQSIEQVEEQAPSAAELVQQDEVQEDAAAQVAVAEAGDTGDIGTNLETSGEFIEITPTAADETLDMSTLGEAGDLDLTGQEDSGLDLTVADDDLLESVAVADINLEDTPVPAHFEETNDVANDDFAAATATEDCGDDFLTGSLEDDEDFERLLAAGSDIEPTAEDFDALAVADEADDALAASPDLDLGDAAAVGPDVAAVVAVLAPLQEELIDVTRQRLLSLEMPVDAVTPEVILGADEDAVRHCYAEGYEPIRSLLPEMPRTLQLLEQEQRDFLFVRLQDTAGGDNWNHLFTEDFANEHAPAPEPEVAPEQEAAGEEAQLDDVFGAGLDDDFEDEFAAAADADIEEAFADFDADSMAVASDTAEIEAEAVEDTTVAVVEPVADEAAAVPLETLDRTTDAVEETPGAQADIEVFEPTPVNASGIDWAIPATIEFDYTSASSNEVFAEFLDAFIEEGSAEIEKLENLVGEWEKNIDNEAVLAEVSRTLHTIKGIAKGVGLHRLGTLVHNFETLLDKLPQPDEDGEQSYFRIVNAWLDAVVRGVEFVADERADIASELPTGAGAQATTEATEHAAEQAAEEPEAAEAPEEELPEPVQATVHESAMFDALEKKRDQQLADDGAKALAAQQSVRITSEKLDHLLNLASQAQQFGVRASQNLSRSKRSSSELQGRLTSVRTHIRKIADRALFNVNARGSSNTEMDALEMDQYSELQEAASILREGVEDLTELVDLLGRQNNQIEAMLKQQSTVISGISSSIQGARVVPVSRLMPGLRRIVRTVATDLGKVVSFKVLNETGALDRDRYARLQVILEHMVRNALDHGIEAPDDRVAMGKPTGGRITIDVRKSGGDYLIKLSDDGRGIDPDAIRESAYEKGIDVDVDSLSDEQALRLIFHKGFSTANEVSEISGRGVGMDIVLTELQQIGGEIEISSTLGLGTTFEVRIPSNVTVNGALLVSAAGDSYAIPLNGLVAVEQVPVDDFFDAVAAGEALSLVDIDCEPAYLGTLCQGVGLPDRTAWESYVPVIIAGEEGRYMAIAIDNLEEALELVVRSIGPQFSTVSGVAGAATTSDGEAIVALDLNLLVASAGTDGIAPVAMSQPEDSNLLVLVVDDSRTQRMVATSQLDTVGVESVTAENGLVAIDLLNTTHRLPDIVLLDVEMPVKDGIETLREIRKSHRYGEMPVIMVTSRTGAKHRAMAKDAGCNAYMGKPFNFPALIDQINALTGHELQLS
ncbi:MAG: response regulator, partial [Halioglobus sp.]|nr:response regulator [Halioglobus sp.]